MSYKKFKVLLDLAEKQNIRIRNVKELVIFEKEL